MTPPDLRLQGSGTDRDAPGALDLESLKADADTATRILARLIHDLSCHFAGHPDIQAALLPRPRDQSARRLPPAISGCSAEARAALGEIWAVIDEMDRISDLIARSLQQLPRPRQVAPVLSTAPEPGSESLGDVAQPSGTTLADRMLHIAEELADEAEILRRETSALIPQSRAA